MVVMAEDLMSTNFSLPQLQVVGLCTEGTSTPAFTRFKRPRAIIPNTPRSTQWAQSRFVRSLPNKSLNQYRKLLDKIIAN